MKPARLAAAAVLILFLLAVIGGLAMLLRHVEVTVNPTTVPTPEFAGEAAVVEAGNPVVYESSFMKASDAAWTNYQLDQTPSGSSFLGQFGNDDVTFKIAKLPPHQFVRVSFDLYIINTWDGIASDAWGHPAGPDFVSIDLAGGPNLLRATFSNLPDTRNFMEEGKLQTYPSPIPSKPNKGGTGASAKNALGYVFDWHRGPNSKFPMDATYPIKMTLPHNADAIQLNFAASGLTGVTDESWGIASMKVEVLQAADVPPPSPEAMNAAWTKLLGEDAVAAREAFWQLVAGGDATVKFLETSGVGFGIDPAELKSAVDGFRNGDADAHDRLLKMGVPIEPFLREAVRSDPSLTDPVANLLEDVELAPIEYPAARQAAAVSRLLTVINTGESHRVHDQLLSKPQIVFEPGTAGHAADWKRRFDAVYHLEPGERIKYIAPPFIPEREAFLLERHKLWQARSGGNSAMEKASFEGVCFVGRTNSTLRPADATAYGNEFNSLQRLPKTLTILNMQCPGPGNRPLVISQELQSLDLPGDWLLRSDAKDQDFVAIVSGIIEAQLKRKVEFVPQTIQEDVIVMRGTFNYVPEDESEPKGHVHVYSDARVPIPATAKLPEYTVKQFASILSQELKIPFIDESQSPDAKLRWIVHPSARVRRGEEYDPAKLAQVLEHLSKQTSMTFTLEKRPKEVMLVRETK
jgi:hypothetical protein